MDVGRGSEIAVLKNFYLVLKVALYCSRQFCLKTVFCYSQHFNQKSAYFTFK